jgi:hypothetical protein
LQVRQIAEDERSILVGDSYPTARDKETHFNTLCDLLKVSATFLKKSTDLEVAGWVEDRLSKNLDNDDEIVVLRAIQCWSRRRIRRDVHDRARSEILDSLPEYLWGTLNKYLDMYFV